MRSKELSNWRTLLVVEELEEEFSIIEKQKTGLDQIMIQIKSDESYQSEALSLRGRIHTFERRKKFHQNDENRLAKLDRKIEEARAALKDIESKLEESHHKVGDMIIKRESAFHPIWGADVYQS